MEEMLDFLDNYFQKKSKEAVKAKFDKYNKAKYEGASLAQYLQNFAKQHNFLPALASSRQEKAKIYGDSVFSEKIQEEVSFVSIDAKVKVEREVSFIYEAYENFYTTAA